MHRPAVFHAAQDGTATKPRLRWWKVLGAAVLIAILIRTFVLEPFRIPTQSMEQTLIAGDFVLVSKLHYGPRLPLTVGLPFSDYYIKGVHLPYVRIPGPRHVERGDVVVFNYPRERGPIDQKTHYIKRVVGLPGDTVVIRDKRVEVNGRGVAAPTTGQQRWLAAMRSDEAFPAERLRDLGVEPVMGPGAAPTHAMFEATAAVAKAVESWDEVASVVPLVRRAGGQTRTRTFPEGSGYSPDQYGPLYVPAQGDTLHLTSATWPLFKTIAAHDGQQIDLGADGRYILNESLIVDRYVVQQDYFFVMGDNRDNSEDSRSWGFVPADHIVGKAMIVYFSWDDDAREVRFDRMFEPIE